MTLNPSVEQLLEKFSDIRQLCQRLSESAVRISKTDFSFTLYAGRARILAEKQVQLNACLSTSPSLPTQMTQSILGSAFTLSISK